LEEVEGRCADEEGHDYLNHKCNGYCRKIITKSLFVHFLGTTSRKQVTCKVESITCRFSGPDDGQDSEAEEIQAEEI
jgi:hypothetical protein